MDDDGFDHRLDDQFARLRDSTMTHRPDLRDEFDACLPQHLRPSLTDLLVARAIAGLADDWVSRWLIRLAWVILAVGAGVIAWALLWLSS